MNPVIPILLKEYRYIKYKRHGIKYDISYLVNSFNIVSGKSSFLISIIKLNDNLKYLWEYDFYKLSERYYHFLLLIQFHSQKLYFSNTIYNCLA